MAGPCRGFIEYMIQTTSRPMTVTMPKKPTRLMTMARFRLRVARLACGFFRSNSCPHSLQMTALHRTAPTVPRYQGHGPLRTDFAPHFGQGTREFSSFRRGRRRGRSSSSMRSPMRGLLGVG